MYFVCKSCMTALKVDPEKVPPKPVYYKCKSCGTVSVVQDNLRPFPPLTVEEPLERRPEPPPQMAPSAGNEDGTIYHCVSGLSVDSGSLGAYELRCAVKPRQGGEKNYVFSNVKVTIGRGAEVDITVDDPLASRCHAELERVRDQVILKDLNSTNGTYVNDERITAHILADGDVARVGNTCITVVLRAK